MTICPLGFIRWCTPTNTEYLELEETHKDNQVQLELSWEDLPGFWQDLLLDKETLHPSMEDDFPLCYACTVGQSLLHLRLDQQILLKECVSLPATSLSV